MHVLAKNGPVHGKRIFGLDVLRALAILGVLLSHSRYVIPARFESIIIVFRGGTLGVELFFVLSGFLIGTILLSLLPRFNSFITLLHFWQRRWLRTLPNYFLFFLLNIVISLLVASQLPDLFPFLFFFQNWLWPHPSFFGEAWSLAIEEWFYLLFPLCVFLLARILKTNKNILFVALAFLILPTIIRVVWAASGHTNWDEDFRKIVWLRLDAIMYGVIAAWVKREFNLFWQKARVVLMLVGFCLLLAMTFYMNRYTLYGNFFAETFLFSIMSFSCALLLPLFDQWTISNENAVTQGIHSLALWSYSLYLVNLLVVAIINHLTGGPEALTSYSIVFSWSGYFIASILISALNYRCFEKPFMDLRDKKRKLLTS